MSEKKSKVTIRDIARESGVSIATVSYILNNREDQSISEATRQKVLQIVNLHQYRINLKAQCISSGNTKIIALYCGETKFALAKAETMQTIEKIQRTLSKKGYSLTIITDNEIKYLSNCDAIICENVTSKFFKDLGEVNFCPLIAFNSIIPNDNLFYQLNIDFEKIKRLATNIFGDNYTVVSLPMNNLELEQELLSVFPNTLIVNDFKFHKEIENKNVLAIGSGLQEYISKHAKDSVVIDICNNEKLEKLYECLNIAINHLDSINHNLKF